MTVSSVLIGTLALGSLALSSFETPEAVSDAETAVSASDTTLAATEYIVRYNSNGGYNPPAQQIKKSGETLILTEAVPNSPGWTFCGWSKTADGEVALQARRTLHLEQRVTPLGGLGNATAFMTT